VEAPAPAPQPVAAAAPAAVAEAPKAQEPPRTMPSDSELDIPAFLRRR
jgi:hypothetical protein